MTPVAITLSSRLWTRGLLRSRLLPGRSLKSRTKSWRIRFSLYSSSWRSRRALLMTPRTSRSLGFPSSPRSRSRISPRLLRNLLSLTRTRRWFVKLRSWRTKTRSWGWISRLRRRSEWNTRRWSRSGGRSWLRWKVLRLTILFFPRNTSSCNRNWRVWKPSRLGRTSFK